MPPPRINSRSITAWQFAAPLALLAVAMLLCALLGLYWASRQIDAAALDGQRGLVQNALLLQQDRLRSQLASELQWDEAVAKMVNQIDLDWVDSQIAEWFYTARGVQRVLLFDGDDRPVYYAEDGVRGDGERMLAQGLDTAPLLAAVRRAEQARGNHWQPAPNYTEVVSKAIDAVAIASPGGRPAIVIATLVQPDFGRALPRAARSSIVVTVRWIDAALIAEIAATLRLRDAGLGQGAQAASGRASLAVNDAGGKPVAWLEWTPERPGTSLLRTALPFVAFGCIGLLALATTMLLRTWALAQRLLASEREAVVQTGLLERMSQLGNIGAWEFDPIHGKLTLSRQSYLMAELEPEVAVTPELAVGLYRGDSCARVVAAMRGAVVDGTPFDFMVEMRSSGGNERIARIQGIPERAGQLCLRVIGTVQDITAQVQREQLLAQQAHLLERMSAIANIGGWEYVTDTRTLTFTDHARRIHGLAADAPLSFMRALRMYPASERERIVQTVRRSSGDGTPWDIDLPLTTPDGRSIWVRTMGEAEFRAGRLVRWFGVIQDITRAREVATELAAAMESLRERNLELQEFTRAASHDLQEPVRKVQALGSLVIDQYGAQIQPAARGLIERMQGAAARMAALIGDLLTYSRVTAKSGQFEPVSLDTIAHEVLGDLEFAIAACGAQVRFGALGMLAADATQMRQLLQNLIGNAIKYRHPERPVRIDVMAHTISGGAGAADTFRIVVSDNGIGFDNHFREAIFAPFQRLHDRTTYDGTGMGLAIVRRIAERHGGRAWADGQPGVGARFTVELPLSHGTPR
jgi:signal transduction histidine kinase